MISFLRLLVGLQIYLQIVCSQKKTKTKQYQKLHFFFYKNIFYKNMEAEICKILRIWSEQTQSWKGYNFVCWKSVNTIQLYVCNWNYFFLLTAKLATKKQSNVPLSLTAINTPVHSKPEKSEATI